MFTLMDSVYIFCLLITISVLKKNQIRPIFSDEHSTRSYSAMLTLVNKVESNVLYKVRLSTHAKKNVMVKSNMGLLLANNITTITLDVVDNDEPAFNVQIVTTWQQKTG